MKNGLFSQLTVNYHLWEPCQMKCGFCFAPFQDVKKTILPKGHIGKEQSIELVRELAQAGFNKINFAGGEPTLCPWLYDLIVAAKEGGMVTSIISNGQHVTEGFLTKHKEVLDLIGISIDSGLGKTNLRTGRYAKGFTPDYNFYLTLSDNIKSYQYPLKVNTVVNRYNLNEDFIPLISEILPLRWKVLKVLAMIGQNDSHINDFTISELEFRNFVKSHSVLPKEVEAVFENNDEMKGSYIMVDPAGRFFDNQKGYHNYSDPILNIGVREAFKQVWFSQAKFFERDGFYEI